MSVENIYRCIPNILPECKAAFWIIWTIFSRKNLRFKFLTWESSTCPKRQRSVALIRFGHQGRQRKNNSLLLNFQTFYKSGFSLTTERNALASYYFVKLSIKFFLLKKLSIKQESEFGGRELTAARRAFSRRWFFSIGKYISRSAERKIQIDCKYILRKVSSFLKDNLKKILWWKSEEKTKSKKARGAQLWYR